MTTAVAIAGGNGRMGRTLIELVLESQDFELAAVTLAPGEPVPTIPGLSEAICGHDINAALGAAQVLIDFTVPAITKQHAQACADTATAWVLGTTGLTEQQQAAVAAVADSVPVCQAANFSTGVTLMLSLVEQAARAVDDQTDLEVIEAHHRHKVDAPSGTALAIGEAMAAARGLDLDRQAILSREGITGPRPAGAIGFATVRAGDIVGEHTALFASDGERLEITHRAGTRDAFARGALRAARWLDARPPGLFDMRDVLGLRQAG